MPADKTQLDALRIDRTTHRPGRRIWVPISVAVLVVLAGTVAFRLLSGPGAIRVRTATVRATGDSDGATTVLNATGYVTARRRATVSSKVTGRVVEIRIEEGMRVEQGEVLARLDASNIEASHDLARAGVAAARSVLAETEVRLHEANLSLSRTINLVAESIASQADLDGAQAEVDSLKARLARQRQEVAVAEGELRLWRRQLDDMTIRAPFAGVVVSKDAQPGEMISPVSAGGGFTRTGIGTLVDMTSLEIEVDVNESYINRVVPQQKVEAVLDAYPDWRIPSHVIAIIPTADRQKATVRVRIGLDELDPRVLPEMGVKVAFQETGPRPTQGARLQLPSSAVREQDGAARVFVVGDGRVERRAIVVGRTEGGRVDVTTGLAAGERVVLDPPESLEDGDEIEEID